MSVQSRNEREMIEQEVENNASGVRTRSRSKDDAQSQSRGRTVDVSLDRGRSGSQTGTVSRSCSRGAKSAPIPGSPDGVVDHPAPNQDAAAKEAADREAEKLEVEALAAEIVAAKWRELEAQRQIEERRARVARMANELAEAQFVAEQQAAQLAADQIAAEEMTLQQQRFAIWEAQRQRDAAELQARHVALEQQHQLERERQARAAEQAAFEQRMLAQEAAAAAAGLNYDLNNDANSINTFPSLLPPHLGPTDGGVGADVRRQSPSSPD